MIHIARMAPDHRLWNETLLLAANCSWKAGPVLAERMRSRAFHGWEQVFAACVGGRVAGFCTLAEKDELPQDNALTPFIGFVFVDEPHRGKRLSQRLIQSATAYARELGFESVYLMSGEIGLYEKYGFRKLGDYETIYGGTDQLFVRPTAP